MEEYPTVPYFEEQYPTVPPFEEECWPNIPGWRPGDPPRRTDTDEAWP